MKTRAVFAIIVGLAVAALPVQAAFGPSEISEKTRECMECHKDQTPGINQQWGGSKHYRANVGCYECHQPMQRTQMPLIIMAT